MGIYRVIEDSPNRITQHYKKGVHNGVDLGWRTDERANRVYSNCVGVVYATLDNVPHGSEQGGGWGNYVLIKHPNGMFSRYAHLQSGLLVRKGQQVYADTQIGVIGNSGRSTARHLHFEVQTGASSTTRINPEPYLTQYIYEESPAPTPSGDEQIRYIQNRLNERYGVGLVVDGIYGPATKKGLVKALQHELNVQYRAGLVEDGIFGTKTKNACPTLRQGADGWITWNVQCMLYCRGNNPGLLDGIFGTSMKNAVIAFQRNNGLAADGIVGKNTYYKLYS